MERHRFLRVCLGLGTVRLAGCSATAPVVGDDEAFEVVKSEAEWLELLTYAEYLVLFGGTTEFPFSSPLLSEHRVGTYICKACLLPLFPASTKYETGTGWPSFWDAIDGGLRFRPDFELGERRTEYHCRRCGGHQGHVFDDGPRPTSKRYCNNGLALLFVPSDEPLPPLRT